MVKKALRPSTPTPNCSRLIVRTGSICWTSQWSEYRSRPDVDFARHSSSGHTPDLDFDSPKLTLPDVHSDPPDVELHPPYAEFQAPGVEFDAPRCGV